MTCVTTDSSQLVARRLRAVPASRGLFGLTVGDVFKTSARPAGSAKQSASIEKPALEEQIYVSLEEAKIWTSKVAMHMDIASRDRFFRQLDRLHDIEEWSDGEQPVRLTSYQNFIRFMLTSKSNSKPSLGLNAVGELVAIWLNGDDRLTVQFVSDGHVEWVVSHRVGSELERAAGSTSVSRLTNNLSPYDPSKWLGEV